MRMASIAANELARRERYERGGAQEIAAKTAPFASWDLVNGRSHVNDRVEWHRHGEQRIRTGQTARISHATPGPRIARCAQLFSCWGRNHGARAAPDARVPWLFPPRWAGLASLEL